jgi:long-subunit acyl-CoA synthetase (AMP-forming)
LLIYSKAQEAKINFETVQMPCYTVSDLAVIFKREEKVILLLKRNKKRPAISFYTSGTTGIPKGVCIPIKCCFGTV